ncbi:MAG: PaaI family thioesterase, partial [Rubrivivax sp.]
MTEHRPTHAELAAFLLAEFPQNRCTLEEIDEDGSVVVAHPVGERELRPGGTVSGPVMMTLADVALYVAVL